MDLCIAQTIPVPVSPTCVCHLIFLVALRLTIALKPSWNSTNWEFLFPLASTRQRWPFRSRQLDRLGHQYHILLYLTSLWRIEFIVFHGSLFQSGFLNLIGSLFSSGFIICSGSLDSTGFLGFIGTLGRIGFLCSIGSLYRFGCLRAGWLAYTRWFPQSYWLAKNLLVFSGPMARSTSLGFLILLARLHGLVF